MFLTASVALKGSSELHCWQKLKLGIVLWSQALILGFSVFLLFSSPFFSYSHSCQSWLLWLSFSLFCSVWFSLIFCFCLQLLFALFPVLFWSTVPSWCATSGFDLVWWAALLIVSSVLTVSTRVSAALFCIFLYYPPWFYSALCFQQVLLESFASFIGVFCRPGQRATTWGPRGSIQKNYSCRIHMCKIFTFFFFFWNSRYKWMWCSEPLSASLLQLDWLLPLPVWARFWAGSWHGLLWR